MWPEWARHAIAEVNRPVYIAPLDVGEYSFERRHVAVNICDEGDTHCVAYGQ